MSTVAFVVLINMISSCLVVLIANCIPLSGGPLGDEMYEVNTNFDSFENYVEQKVQQQHRYSELLSQMLWQTPLNKSVENNSVTQSEHSQTFVILESVNHYLPSNDELSELSGNERSKRSGKTSISKTVHNILMEDITYGIFGHCYNVSLFSEKPFVMIDRCPKYTPYIDDVVRCHTSKPFEEFDQCLIDLQLVPVTDQRGYMYKNIYCARCHGIAAVTTWEVELSFNSPSSLRFFEQDKSLTFMGELHHTSQCMASVYPLKPKGLLLCEDLKFHPKHSHFYHNNDHHRRHIEYQVGSQDSKEYPLSFQILMNFGINGKGHVFFSTTAMAPVVEHKCQSNEIYDPDVKECRQVVCKLGYTLVDRKCIHKDQNYESMSQSDMIDAASKSDFALEVTYRINVTSDSLILFDGSKACDDITQAFADMMNISTNRIFNFKINLLNGTSPKKTMAIRQIEAFTVSAETNSSVTLCEEQTSLRDAYFGMKDHNEMITVEFSFSLSPYKDDKNANHLSNDYLKKKLLLEGSFNFVINGTEFHTENSAANTDVELDLWCTKGKKDQKFDHEFDVIPNKDGDTCVYVNSTGKFYPTGMYNLWIWVTGKIGNISDVSTNVYVFLCDLPKIEDKNCARFQIESSSYTRLPNSSLLLLEGNRVVDMNEYEYVSEDSYDVQICVPESLYLIEPMSSSISFGCGVNYKNVLLAEGYISFVLGIVSIIVLTAVIVTYSIFKKLRNLPGLNTMSLTLTLWLGELIFITSGSVRYDDEIICAVIGACLHYIFLASFFWMNVMSYDVFRTFGNKCILMRIRRKQTYFPRYSLYAWGAPALIVGICCVLDFTQCFPDVTIGYGGSRDNSDSIDIKNNVDNATETIVPLVRRSKQKFGCWIQNPVAALIAFGSPMIAILLANSIMFVRTIICIRSVTKFVSLSTRRSPVKHAIGKHDVMLYVRMSTVMGFTWVFGLASSIVTSFADKPTDSVCITLHILGLLFIIFNCSQGLFVFFVFVLNRRVGALYKEFFGRMKQNVSRHSSTTSLSSVQHVAAISENTYF